MKYCKACGQNVQPTKKFSIVWFLINCLWLVGGIVYILYYLFAKSKVCPICCGNQLEVKRDIIDSTTGEPVLDYWEKSHKKSQEKNAQLRERLEKVRAGKDDDPFLDGLILKAEQKTREKRQKKEQKKLIKAMR